MAGRIDPRLRARRAAVRRAEGRRRLRFVVVGAAILGLIFAGWAALRSPLLDLDHIEVHGLGPSRLAEGSQVVGPVRGTPLKDVDSALIEADLEALPWVLDAAVEKSWPGTVRVEVVERTAVARLTGPDGPGAVVDAVGAVIAEGGDRYRELPMISLESSAQPGQVEPEALPGLKLIEVLPDDLAAWVEAVTYRPGASERARGLVGFDLVGEAEADLGEPTLLADKVQALRTVINGIDLTCVRTIDVAVADFPTVRRDPGCAARAGIERP
ncbi:MAG: FtsQ-type POTRA domain-containing protein [Acidimicrobiaceae bacterium]|nr:FtsQ-type POTRA domain-containing protein [Acidimicrobiaceae bacterium]